MEFWYWVKLYNCAVVNFENCTVVKTPSCPLVNAEIAKVFILTICDVLNKLTLTGTIWFLFKYETVSVVRFWICPLVKLVRSPAV